MAILNNAYMNWGIMVLIIGQMMENNVMNIYKLVTLHQGMEKLWKRSAPNTKFKKPAHIMLQKCYRNQLENVHIVPIRNMPM